MEAAGEGRSRVCPVQVEAVYNLERREAGTKTVPEFSTREPVKGKHSTYTHFCPTCICSGILVREASSLGYAVKSLLKRHPHFRSVIREEQYNL